MITPAIGARPSNTLGQEDTLRFFTVNPVRTALVTAAAATLLGSMLVTTPANAVSGQLNSADEQTIRATMQQAGIAPAVEDQLIAKLQSGQQLDSELETAVPVLTSTTTEAAGPVTTQTFADGSIRTSLTVNQTVDGSSTRVYVAHPTLECNLIHCTLIYPKADTKYMATGSFATVAAIITAACGPAAWACGIGAGIVIDVTHNAYSSGKCIALQKVIAAGPPYPVIVGCRE